MVSYVSKLPNSARNAITNFLTTAEDGSERHFFKLDTKTWGNWRHNQKDFTQLSLKLRE